MYNILKLAIDITQKLKKFEFTTRELSQQCGICEGTLSKNLSRLVKVGLLERIEYHVPNVQVNNTLHAARGSGRKVKYKINGDMLDFIKNNLY